MGDGGMAVPGITPPVVPLFSLPATVPAALCPLPAPAAVPQEKVDNHVFPVEKYLSIFLLPIIFDLFLHSQKRTPCICGNDSVAQLVEQYTFNVWVLGSSPSGIT